MLHICGTPFDYNLLNNFPEDSMNKFLMCIVIIMALFYCSDDISHEPTDISIQLNKSDMPGEVTEIRGLLFRADYDTINLRFAEVGRNFIAVQENISPGVWDMRLEGFEASDTMICSCDSSVELIKGETTTLEMNLIPTSNYDTRVWKQKSDMPTARWANSAAYLNGKIYVLGGIPDNTSTTRNNAYTKVEIYDPVQNKWGAAASMITNRCNFPTLALNNKLYAIGGTTSLYAGALNSLEEYDPLSNSWAVKAYMTRYRKGVSAAIYDGKIYVIGGSNDSGLPISKVNVYDPLSDSWDASKADMLTARSDLVSVELDGVIYAIGGQLGTTAGELSLTTVEAYNPLTDTWSVKPDMITPRKYFSACSLNGKIYVIGGAAGFCGPTVAEVEAYDPATDSWEQCTPMPNVLTQPGVAVLDGKIYVSGGAATACPSTGLKATYEYNPINER